MRVAGVEQARAAEQGPALIPVGSCAPSTGTLALLPLGIWGSLTHSQGSSILGDHGDTSLGSQLWPGDLQSLCQPQPLCNSVK